MRQNMIDNCQNEIKMMAKWRLFGDNILFVGRGEI